MALEVQNNPFPSVLMVEAADETDPTPDALPAAGQQRLIVGPDSLLYLLDSTGTATLVGGGGGIANPLATDSLWDAAGDLVQGTGANTSAKLSAGTAGKVLTSNGAAAALTWETPSGGGSGGLVLLEQHTATNASPNLDFTSFISSTYDQYQIEIVNIVPATNSVGFFMRMGTGGGPTIDTGANYGWVTFTYRAAAISQTGADSGATAIQMMLNTTVSNSANWGIIGSLKLYSPQDTTLYKRVTGNIDIYEASPFVIGNLTNGVYRSSTAITAVRFYVSSGNIASGTIRIYGIAK